MTKLSPKQTRESSVSALKVVYYVIIGLAITEGLHRVFLEDGSFLGLQVFRGYNLPSTILLLALLPTICRFVHGACLHLDMISDKRYKPLIDFLGFFAQAGLFYLMATSLEKPVMFSLLFGLMLLFDALWLASLRLMGYIALARTEKQWLGSGLLHHYHLPRDLVERQNHVLSLVDMDRPNRRSAGNVFGLFLEQGLLFPGDREGHYP